MKAVCDLYDSTEPSPYHLFLSIKDLGNYQIHIKDAKTNKTNVVDVPMTEDPTDAMYMNRTMLTLFRMETTTNMTRIRAAKISSMRI